METLTGVFLIFSGVITLSICIGKIYGSVVGFAFFGVSLLIIGINTLPKNDSKGEK